MPPGTRLPTNIYELNISNNKLTFPLADVRAHSSEPEPTSKYRPDTALDVSLVLHSCGSSSPSLFSPNAHTWRRTPAYGTLPPPVPRASFVRSATVLVEHYGSPLHDA